MASEVCLPKKFEEVTERLCKDQLMLFGFDTLTINHGTKKAEVAVYDKDSIVDMQIVQAEDYRCAHH